MRIGIIGGGISGLASAWLMQNDHEVTLFEKQPRLGGHADTVEIEQDGELIPIEAGLEFFFDSMFPRFVRLLNLLDVPIHRYNASGTLYSTDHRKTTLLPPFGRDRIVWSAYSPRALYDLAQFQMTLMRSVKLMDGTDPFITIEQHLNSLNLSETFKNEILYPLFLAGWCVDIEDFKTFSAYNAMKYIVMNRPLAIPPIIKVNEIAGGMSSYINVLTGKLTRTAIKRSTEIASISRTDTEYIVHDSQGETYTFDHLIMATGPYEASALLKSLPGAEKTRTELDRIEVFKTIIAVHEDPRLMPANRDHWSVVNTRYDAQHSSNTVWKKWRSKRPIFRSWVTYDTEMPDKLHLTRTYYHPKINGNYYRAQSNLVQLQGTNNLWLAGLYMHDIDCHESALMSAVNIAHKLAPQSENLQKLMASPTMKKDGKQ